MSIWETVGGILKKTPQHEVPELTQVDTATTTTVTTQRFIDHGDGTVTDSRTGLMWMRCSVGEDWTGTGCAGRARYLTLQEANALDLQFSGHDDWRLPTSDELRTIVDLSCGNPTLDTNIFLGSGRIFLTSTGDDEARHCVSFYTGRNIVAGSHVRNDVRLVRSVLPSKDQSLVAIAGKSIDSTGNKEWQGSGFDFLLREIERNERPSATLMKSLATNPEVVKKLGGRLDRTLLHHAAAHNKLEIVKYLCLRYFANVNATEKDGETPLDYALAVNAVDVVDFLRSKGAKTRLELLEPMSPVSSVIDVEPLLNETQNSRITSNERDAKSLVSDELKAALKEALTECALPRGDLINFVHKHPSLINVRLFEMDKTMLHLAARAGKLEVVRWLIGKGARVDVLDSYGASPIWTANSAGAVEVANYLKTVAVKTTLTVLVAGTGKGSATNNPQQETYGFGSRVRLLAAAEPGSVFTGWSGDVTGSELACDLVMDSDKQVIASFEQKSYSLHVSQTGQGRGSIIDGSETAQIIEQPGGTNIHPAGVLLTLTAAPDHNSVFAGWSGAITSREPRISLLMDADKSLVAHFEEKSYSLAVACNGGGKGVISIIPEGQSYPMGACVSLTAVPENGSLFSAWSGDINESTATCTVVMDADKTLTATFALESFPLSKSITGSGSGSVTSNPETESHEYGSKVTLTAKPAEGSIFIGWAGDATGLDSRCTVEVDSAKHIVAEFQKIEIPDLEVAVSFDSVEQANMKSGDDAFIVYLAIANKGQKQIRIELPLASYLTQKGEEIEQDVWLSGLINGAQGASIRAGAFRKVGLVFFKQKLKSISTGDQLFVSVCQDKPAQRCNYTLRCLDKDAKTFVLIQAELEEVMPVEIPAVIPEVVAQTADSAEVLLRIENHEAMLNRLAAQNEVSAGILPRIEMLQATLDEVLRQLAKLQTPTPPVIQQSAAQPEPAAPASSQTAQQTLPQVLAWLTTQQRVSAATLRSLLLPLDLLPSALIDEINERALDIVGEPALEDQDDEILVTQEVLAEILTDWDVLNEFPDPNKE